MADHSKWFEITVAALGIGVTAFLGFSQIRLGNIQQEAATKQATENIEVQIFQLVAPHLENLSKSDPQADNSRRIVEAMAEFLSDTQKRENLAKIALKIARTNPNATPADLYRLEEATSAGGTGQWFAVLASLPGNNEAAAKASANAMWQQWKSKGGGEIPIKLYRTKISNNFAIVAGTAAPQDRASDLVRKAKQWGVAGDAFAQQDKAWKEVGAAPF
jgi:hypothetical protein